MKKSINYIIVFCLGLMLASTGAFAAVGDVIETSIAKYTIKVDGVVQDMEVDQLNRDGTVYVPLRAFANMLGKDVVFKGNAKEIELNTPVIAEAEAKRVIETTVDIPIQEKIKMIEAEIRGAEGSIVTWSKTSAATVDEELKAQIDDAIEQIRQKLSDLKAEKAALEAQQ